MFLGHAALGFAAQRHAPRTPIAWLLAAPFLADLIWPVLVLTGVEKVAIAPGITAVTPLDFVSYPWSHSLLMSGVWAALAGGLYWRVRKDARGAWWLAALVVSHWVLDWVSHRRDVPLMPFVDCRVGLGLWYSKSATVAVEAVMLATGLGLYLAATRVRSWLGHLSLWSLVALLVGIYVMNLTSPPPPSDRAVAMMVLGLWLLLPWGWWIWATREVKGSAPAGSGDVGAQPVEMRSR